MTFANHPPSRMTRLLAFWTAADAVLEEHRLPPLRFEEAVDWHDLEIDPADIPTSLRAAMPRDASLRTAALRITPQRNASSEQDPQ